MPIHPIDREKIVHVSTVHRRNDVRIFLKEAMSLCHYLDAEVVLCVQDGGPDEGGQIPVYSTGPHLSVLHQRLTVGNWRAFSRIKRLNPTVVHLHDPELILIGIILKAVGIRVILDVHEDYRQVVRGLKRRSRLTKEIFRCGIAAFEWIASNIFDGVVCATDRIANNFRKKNLVVVRNFPSLDEMSFGGALPYNERPYNAVYVGGITELRGAVEMVQAVSEVRNEEVRLLLAGAFKPPELQNRVAGLKGWGSVNYSGWADRVLVADLLSRSRVGLVMLHPHGNYVESLPTKMFEYMSAGIPVILSNFPLFMAMVEKYKCGVVADPKNPVDIARAIEWMFQFPTEAEEMGRRGREAVVNELNWENEAKKLVEFYHSQIGIRKKEILR